MTIKATPTTTGTCTIPGCGEPAIYRLEGTGGGTYFECAGCFIPTGTTIAEPAAVVGEVVQVRHCGIVKAGPVVKETPTKVHVEVPVKPHGRAATTRVIVVAKAEVIR